MSEQVLVFPADRLEPYLPKFEAGGGIVTDPVLIEEIMWHAVNSATFMDREAAEADPNFKQLIPYCALHSSAGGAKYVFVYRRTSKGGESRLHSKLSLGVGGHINPCDAQNGDVYEAGLLRELSEEVGLTIDPKEAPAVALIYDPSNEVGKVHFGVVHTVKVKPKQLSFNDPALADGFWAGRHTLNACVDGCDKGKFENWSALVAEHVLNSN